MAKVLKPQWQARCIVFGWEKMKGMKMKTPVQFLVVAAICLQVFTPKARANHLVESIVIYGTAGAVGSAVDAAQSRDLADEIIDDSVGDTCNAACVRKQIHQSRAEKSESNAKAFLTMTAFGLGFFILSN